jgi:hypothetical protein
MTELQPQPTAPLKKLRGQFYTVNCNYILQDLSLPPEDVRCVIEPFAGKGDLIDWLKGQKPQSPQTLHVEAYDIEPKHPTIIKRDTLLDPPDYSNAWILTNPPYLARNKCTSKEIFDKYNSNDLYKCFITSLLQQQTPCRGGIFIIPAGFFMSPRDVDVRCRSAFLRQYRITRVKYFEEDVFPDTPTTIVAFSFERSNEPLTEQSVEWQFLPSNQKRTFEISATNDWIIGGDIYKLPTPSTIRIRRHVEGQALKKDEQLTALTLTALDTGKQDGRICLSYKEGYVYPAKDTSRSYATLCISGRTLSVEEQKKLADNFNTFIEEKRSATWSLFLPQYRESKEYARKRIPFELAYTIVAHLLT